MGENGWQMRVIILLPPTFDTKAGGFATIRVHTEFAPTLRPSSPLIYRTLSLGNVMYLAITEKMLSVYLLFFLLIQSLSISFVPSSVVAHNASQRKRAARKTSVYFVTLRALTICQNWSARLVNSEMVCTL